MKKKKAAKKKNARKPVKKVVKKTVKKKAAKKAAIAAIRYKAICNDEGKDLSGWTTSEDAAYAARDAHKSAYPNHSCDVLEK